MFFYNYASCLTVVSITNDYYSIFQSNGYCCLFQANLAAACAAIFYFIGYLPYGFVARWEEIMTTGQKTFSVSLTSRIS